MVNERGRKSGMETHGHRGTLCVGGEEEEGESGGGNLSLWC